MTYNVFCWTLNLAVFLIRYFFVDPQLNPSPHSTFSHYDVPYICRPVGFRIGGGGGVPLPPLSPSSSLLHFPSLPFPSFPLEVGPLTYSQGVWGAPAEIDFGAFWP